MSLHGGTRMLRTAYGIARALVLVTIGAVILAVTELREGTR